MSTPNSKLAAIQMVSSKTLELNLKSAAALIGDAAKKGAQLIILPENFALMGLDDHDKNLVAEKEGSGPIQDFLAENSLEHNAWIVGGTIPIKGLSGKVKASSLVYNNKGICTGYYDKIHLFDVKVPESNESYQESNSTESGSQVSIIHTPFGRLGLSVCYDLRFPELFREMALTGMDIIAVPSAFTARTGAAHWEVLLRARAIENQCYVIASNQGGHHDNGRKTFGHSMIIDPWGTVLACLPQGPGVVLAEMDSSRLSEIRTNFPSLQHARLLPPSSLNHDHRKPNTDER